MKVGYDNRNSSYIEVYVFVVQYMLALSTIFFFSRKPHAQIKAYKIVFVFDIWRSKFEINVWKSISVCVVRTDGCTT